MLYKVSITLDGGITLEICPFGKVKNSFVMNIFKLNGGNYLTLKQGNEKERKSLHWLVMTFITITSAKKLKTRWANKTNAVLFFIYNFDKIRNDSLL